MIVRKSSVAFRSTVGETVHPERIRTIRQGQAIYYQVGLCKSLRQHYILKSPPELRLVSQLSHAQGAQWQGHWYWGFNVNSTHNNLRGTMALRGRSSDEAFAFRIIDTGREIRRTVERLPPPEGKNSIVRMSEECGAKFPHMVPGVEKAGNFTWVSHLSTQYKTVHLH
ncbi:hypothetical protein B0H13DRAFT_1917166 [Mycena leptocephala]|nr:hypothetical protein B0H13DRAFT_1917166 [Mycena leptocephala]